MSSEKGMINGIEYNNYIQKSVLLSSLEESGLWDSLQYIIQDMHTDNKKSLKLLQSEIKYLEENDDIYLIYSEKLYDTENCKVLDKKELLNLTLEDIEFKEEGPFYYFSSVPEI